MKLKRKRFVTAGFNGVFLFPAPLTLIVYRLNSVQGKYSTKEAAPDALWQSVMGFGMLLLLPCVLGILAAQLFFCGTDNDTYKI
ncbi:MAG: ABC transporter permease [Eisenbergiella sp.]